MNLSKFSWCLMLGLLGACSATPETEVRIVLGLASQDRVATSSEDAFVPRSATGLVASGFCYALNVTAPDLNEQGTSNSSACAQGPRGLGKIFGPFAYGAETTLKVPSGADRRFDLLGFKAPTGTRQDCTGVMSVRAVDSGSGSKKVEMSYDGVPMGASVTPLDPSRLSYLFARASSVNLQPGVQTVTLESVDWFEQNLGQGMKNYPTTYACPESSQNGVGPERVSLAWSYIVGSPTLSVARGATAQIQLQLKDVDGNTVSGISAPRLSLDGLLGVGSVTGFASVGDGLYQADISIFAAATVGATRSLVAKIDGQSFLNPARTLVVTSSAPMVDTAVSTVQVNDSFPQAGDELAVQVQLRDGGGNALLGKSPLLRVDVTGTWESSYGVFSFFTDLGNGTYQTTYRPLKAGNHNIRVDVDGVTLQQVPILVVTPGSADSIVISGMPSYIMSETSGTVSIQTRKGTYLIDAVTPSLITTPVGSSTALLDSPTLTNNGVGQLTLNYSMQGRGDFTFQVGGNSGNSLSNTKIARAVMQTGYDPLSLDWNPIEAEFDLAVQGHTAVWTGSEMIVWGGVDTLKTPSPGDDTEFMGLRYRPSEDRWITMSAPPASFEIRKDHTAVWTGSKMIVYGGRTAVAGANVSGGAAYDPNTDTWELLETDNGPDDRIQHTAIWTGTKMILWGGYDQGGILLSDGFAYDPSAAAGSKWTATNTANQPTPRISKAIWTGLDSKMIVFGGYNGSSSLDDGAAYNPSTDSWQTLGAMASPLSRHPLLWTGSTILRIGGLDASVTAVNSTEIYNVGGNFWNAGVAYPLGEVFNHTAVDAPTNAGYVLVWGGQDSSSVATNLGYVYDKSSQSWLWPINASSGVPSLRVGHTAIWTEGAGTRMIIWGGTAP